MNTNNLILKLKKAEDAVTSAKRNLQQAHLQIGPELRKLRLDRRLKQGTVAKGAKLHQSQLYLIEQGFPPSCDVHILERILKVIESNQTKIHAAIEKCSTK